MAASGNYIVESDVDNWPFAVTVTEDFETTAVNITTDKITIVNDIATATEIRFSSTGVVPTPLIAGTIYYAIRSGATAIKVALNAIDAAAETAIDLTGVGSGTHTLDVNGSGSSESDREETIDRAEQLIEKITRDYFYSKAFVKYFDGNANDRLFLGLTPDILTVTEIKISGVVLSTSWWTYDTDSVYLDPEASTGDDLPELLLRLKYKRKIFPRGMGNIKITGTYGWSSCPVAIKQATIILCRYENDETLYTKYDDLISDKLGDATQNRGADKKFLTGLMEADRQIRYYIRNKPVLGVA